MAEHPHHKSVRFDKIYTSDLSRAREVSHFWEVVDEAKEQSAELIAHRHCVEVVVHEQLRDRYYGGLEGQKWEGEHQIPNDAESQESMKRRLRAWLSTLIMDHTPISSSASTPTSSIMPIGGNLRECEEEAKILVVTHEECLLTLVDILTTSTDGKSQSKDGFQVVIDEGVDITTRVGNAHLGIVRLWWTNDQERSAVRGRIEAWGMGRRETS